MKKDIHPRLIEAVLKCACGNQEKIFATKPEIDVEICHKCHPVFVGTEGKRAVIGRVERFHKRYAGEKEKKEEKKEKEAAPAKPHTSKKQ